MQKNPDAFIKSFLKNEEELEELLETIQDSKLGDKLTNLLEKTPAGEALFKEIAEKIENELSEYNEAMLRYEDELTAYEIALDEFINPALIPEEDESLTDQIIAEAEAEAEAEAIVEEAEEVAADAQAEAEVESLVSEEEADAKVGGEIISDEEIIIEEEVVDVVEAELVEEVVPEDGESSQSSSVG